jgi:peptidoglycan/xylan/chitin deacetylase (PgdA/CDA1 family)
MSDKKLLLITFDYELFLGERSGTVQECLISPTDKLIACLNKFDFKAVFFIDTVYMLRLKEIASANNAAKEDLEAITNQLVQLVKKGHEIHPHIHPHWMDAIFNPEINGWSLNEKRYYTFASISVELRKDLFDNSVHFIRSILDMSNSNQPIDSYRAGGWSIQPFENFRPFFIQYGIKHEWSVIPGKYQFSDAHGFDFREAPKYDAFYQFVEDPCRKNEKGPFTEWTISSLTLNRYEKWFDFKISGLLKRMGKRPALKGKTVSAIVNEEGDKYIKKDQKRIIASFEGLNYFTIKKYLSAIRHAKYFQFISHPKLISPYEFNMMDKLFRNLKRGNEIETDFRKAVSE